MNVSVSRIQHAWSTSFTYSVKGLGRRDEWVVLASHTGQALRVFIQGKEGIRCLNLNGVSRSNLFSIKRSCALDLASNAVTTCSTAELDIEHYFLTVLSNAINLGRTTPLSQEMVMEIMEVIGDLRETAEPERLHDYLVSNSLLDLEEGARRFHPCKTELSFWENHWTAIAIRIAEDSKRELARTKH